MFMYVRNTYAHLTYALSAVHLLSSSGSHMSLLLGTLGLTFLPFDPAEPTFLFPFAPETTDMSMPIC
jgi:hypothetical protein